MNGFKYSYSDIAQISDKYKIDFKYKLRKNVQFYSYSYASEGVYNVLDVDYIYYISDTHNYTPNEHNLICAHEKYNYLTYSSYRDSFLNYIREQLQNGGNLFLSTNFQQVLYYLGLADRYADVVLYNYTSGITYNVEQTSDLLAAPILINPTYYNYNYSVVDLTQNPTANAEVIYYGLSKQFVNGSEKLITNDAIIKYGNGFIFYLPQITGYMLGIKYGNTITVMENVTKELAPQFGMKIKKIYEENYVKIKPIENYSIDYINYDEKILNYADITVITDETSALNYNLNIISTGISSKYTKFENIITKEYSTIDTEINSGEISDFYLLSAYNKVYSLGYYKTAYGRYSYTTVYGVIITDTNDLVIQYVDSDVNNTVDIYNIRKTFIYKFLYTDDLDPTKIGILSEHIYYYYSSYYGEVSEDDIVMHKDLKLRKKFSSYRYTANAPDFTYTNHEVLIIPTIYTDDYIKDGLKGLEFFITKNHVVISHPQKYVDLMIFNKNNVTFNNNKVILNGTPEYYFYNYSVNEKQIKSLLEPDFYVYIK